jgi:hypothetical protein
MASLQARHSRTCALGKPWTPAATTEGCTCPRGPLFHVVVRDGRKADRTAVGRNLRRAERALRKIGTQVDDGSYQPQKRIRFEVWADDWIESIEVGPNTRYAYRSTLGYAKDAFGSRDVRRLGPDDVKRMNEKMRKGKLSDSTRAKHLRVLHACLASAIASGYAGSNPVSAVPKGERPRSTRKEAGYFENAELPALFAALPSASTGTSASSRSRQGCDSASWPRSPGVTSTSSAASCTSAAHGQTGTSACRKAGSAAPST